MCQSPFQPWWVLVSFLFIPKPLPLVIDEQFRLLMVMSPHALMLQEKACIWRHLQSPSSATTSVFDTSPKTSCDQTVIKLIQYMDVQEEYVLPVDGKWTMVEGKRSYKRSWLDLVYISDSEDRPLKELNKWFIRRRISIIIIVVVAYYCILSRYFIPLGRRKKI